MQKKIFDLIFAAILLLFFLPLVLLIGSVVFFKLGNPVVFKQRRPGLNTQPFFLYKFRSMNDIRNVNGELVSDAERMTSFGRWLRSTSLDELPSLWNVLKGEMSLVGPRPLLMEYVSLYNAEQARRHEVRPGVTGWAQVNGRNAIGWQDKFRLDVWYVDHQSLWLDIKIIFLTIKKVFFRDGISAEGEATMPKFTGNPSE